MRSLLLHFTWGATLLASAQTVPLDSAIAMAIRHQRFEDSRLNTLAIGDIQQSEAGSSWYPQLTLNAQSTYQNEQFGLPFNLPGTTIPEVPLDFHRVLVNFSQTVYDGEMAKASKELAQLDARQQDLGLAARANQLRGQVTQRYMAVLLSEAQQGLLDLQRNTLSGQRERMTSAVNAGAALASDADQLDAAIISLEQQQVQLRYTVRNLRNDLVILTGDDRLGAAALELPAGDDRTDGEVEQRPDVQAFDLRLRSLDAQADMARAVRLPKLNVFGNAGAGDPGYNSFRDEWRPMLLIGAALQWNILDRGTRKRTDRVLDLQRNLVRSDRDRLVEQLELSVAQQRSDLLQYRELMDTDDRLIQLRGQVTRAKADQLANGTITASEYIAELNNEQAARLGREIHRLRSVLAIRTTLDLLAR